MYAVIRSGGKQYRVAPGDVIRVEKVGTGTDGQVEFNDVLAVSANEGEIVRPGSEARVVGGLADVLGERTVDHCPRLPRPSKTPCVPPEYFAPP